MDEIEAKTLALLNAAEKEMGLTLSRKLDTDLATAVAAARAIEALETEAAENARIIGMSAEREMALRGEVERLRRALAKVTDHDDLIARLRWWGEHGVSGSLNDLVEAADRIEELTAENERLRSLLDAWLGLAREHLDTELAGRTFEALERTRK